MKFVYLCLLFICPMLAFASSEEKGVDKNILFEEDMDSVLFERPVVNTELIDYLESLFADPQTVSFPEPDFSDYRIDTSLAHIKFIDF